MLIASILASTATPALAGHVQIYDIGGEQITNQFVDGVRARVWWKLFEPNEGDYKWARIDNQVAHAKALGKSWELLVGAGGASPSWLYSDYGVPSIEWPDPFNNCDYYRMPVFWDATFQEKFLDMMNAIIGHYYGDSSFAQLKLTGINTVSGEQEVRNRNIACSSIQDEAWLGVGYTDAAAENTFWNLATDEAGYGFYVPISAAIVRQGFPNDADSHIEKWFIANTGSFIKFQNNAWSSTFILAGMNGYQEYAAQGSNFPTAVSLFLQRTNPVPTFAELFDADIALPSNQTALQQLHDAQVP